MANLTERGRMVLGKLLSAEKAGPLPDIDKEILADLKQVAGIYGDEGPTAGDYGKAAMQTVGEAVTLPGRAGRALGVGIEADLRRKEGEPITSGKEALEAFKPSYAPPPDRKIGSLTGNVAGEIAGLAAGGALLKAPKVAGPIYRLGRSAVEASILAGGESAAKGGSVSDVAKSAGFGAAGGLAGGSVAEGVGYGARALGGLIQGKAAAGVGEAALSKLTDTASADLRGAMGSARGVKGAAKSIITRAERSRTAAGKVVGKIRQDLGLPSRRDEAMIEFLDDTAKSADELAASVRERVKAGGPNLFPKGSADPTAKLFAGEAGPQSPEQALQTLRWLDSLKHDLDKLIGWSKIRSVGGGADKIATLDQGALIDIRGQVRDAMSALPLPEAKLLAKAESTFSTKADAYASMLGSIKSEGSAEAMLKQLAKTQSGGLDVSSGLAPGRVTDARNAAKSLGISSAVKKGETQAAANILKSAPKQPGVLPSMIQAMGPAGVLNLFKSGRSIESIGKLLPGSKTATVVGKSLADVLKGRED